MAFRDELARRGLQLIQDPRVAKLMADERVMRALMRAVKLRGQAQDRIDEGIDSIARTLNLATKREIRELKRELRRVEQALHRERERNS